MTGLCGCRKLHILITPVVWVTLAHASIDPRLLPLVPPGTQLVAGISASTVQAQPRNFVLMTGNNKVDLADFFSLVGADSTRSVHQIIFAAFSKDDLSEHSMLVSGHFDQSRVYKSATAAGASVFGYRGIQIAEIQPFGRERERLNEVRWLVILDSSVLLFGSVAITQLELDRYLSHSRTDESLLRRLAHLRTEDQTWCVVSASVKSLSIPAWQREIRSALTALNPELADLALSGDELEFGFFYGRRVEFEYEVALAPIGKPAAGGESSGQSRLQLAPTTSLLSALRTEGANSVRGVFTISKSRFNVWLAGISNRPVGSPSK